MTISHWKAFGTALFSAVLVATLPGSASADPSDEVLTRENYFGESEFQGDGERLGCLDFAADGWGTRAAIEEWHTGTNSWQETTLRCFDDTSRSSDGSGWTWVNGSIKDGTLVRIHQWSSKGSSITGSVYSRSGVA
ncbi:hypothetical protein ABZV75_05995 [Streptomyces flaveolus]|uniref:hypothetical protein n=1 Tax=Streptomyces flaveolus TaxID=67297 RepID=UPI0033B56702